MWSGSQQIRPWLLRFVAAFWTSGIIEAKSKLQYFCLKYNLDRRTTHIKFDPNGVWPHNLQDMDSTFQVPETLAVTTEPSGITKSMYVLSQQIQPWLFIFLITLLLRHNLNTQNLILVEKHIFFNSIYKAYFITGMKEDNKCYPI